MSTEHLLGDISVILDALIGTENAPRHAAEARLSELTVRVPAELLLLFAQVGAQGVGGFQVDQRLLSLILLRRIAFREHPGIALDPAAPSPTAPFDVIPENTRERIERVLDAGLEDEMDTRLRKGLGVCVGEWVNASERRQRPSVSLPDVLLKLAASPRPFHRFTPFQILDAAPSLLSDKHSGQPVGARKAAELLLGGINDPSVDVRIEALKATRGVLHDGMTADDRAAFGSGLVGAAFEVIPVLPLDVLEHALEPMIDIASSFPDLFRPSLHAVVPYLLSCIAPPATLEGHTFTRYAHREMEWNSWCDMGNMAFEVLFSLVIADPSDVVRWEGGYFVSDVVGSLIGRQVASFALEDDHCQEWLEETDLEEEDDSYPAYAEEMLGRLSQILKDHYVIHAVGGVATALMKRPEWRAKYCSLTALACVSEGCYEVMKPEARGLLELISPAAVDAHPRVRYGFLYCISRMSSNLEGVIQTEYADAVLNIALQLLGDDAARVREAAAAAIVHFFEYPDTPLFEDKLKAILTALVTAFLQRGPLYIQEQVLSAISTIATHSHEVFLPYYRDIMDINLKILTATNTTEKEQKVVGRSMRCASLIGQAVGKENFFKDAIPLSQALLVIQNQITTPEDVRKGYLADGWIVIAEVLGRDFAPFLQFVVPPVIKAASYTPTQTPTNILEDEPEENGYDQATSAEAQEKEEAFGQLTVYVHEMRAAYAPYLADTMRVALDAIQYQWSDGVRESACYLIPGLLQAAKDAKIWIADASNLESMFRTLINAIPHELEASGVGQLYQSIGDSLRVLETPLPDTNTTHLAKATLQWLEGVLERRRQRAAEAARPERADFWLWADEEQYEEAAEDEAMNCMDKTFGRIVRQDQHALASMSQIVEMAGRVKAAACAWGEEE